VAIQIVSAPFEHEIITSNPEEVLRKQKEQQEREAKEASAADEANNTNGTNV